MGVRLTFRPEHLSPSFTTMNKFILVTCEYSRYLISSLLVLTRSIQIFLTFTVATRVSSAVNPTPFVHYFNCLKQRLEIYKICDFFAIMVTNKIKLILWIKVTLDNFVFWLCRKFAKIKLTNFCNIIFK